jgi:hypothetical protein
VVNEQMLVTPGVGDVITGRGESDEAAYTGLVVEVLGPIPVAHHSGGGFHSEYRYRLDVDLDGGPQPIVEFRRYGDQCRHCGQPIELISVSGRPEGWATRRHSASGDEQCPLGTRYDGHPEERPTAEPVRRCPQCKSRQVRYEQVAGGEHIWCDQPGCGYDYRTED